MCFVNMDKSNKDRSICEYPFRSQTRYILLRSTRVELSVVYIPPAYYRYINFSTLLFIENVVLLSQLGFIVIYHEIFRTFCYI
jgi:hypothetical protein